MNTLLRTSPGGSIPASICTATKANEENRIPLRNTLRRGDWSSGYP